MENNEVKTIEFIQDKNKGVTVAIMYIDPLEVYQEFCNIITKDFPDWDFEFRDLSDKYIMPDVIKAKTTIAKGDKFSSSRGKEIARTKVLNKYYVKRAAYFRALLDDVNKTVSRLSDAVRFNFCMADKTANAISDYCED